MARIKPPLLLISIAAVVAVTGGCSSAGSTASSAAATSTAATAAASSSAGSSPALSSSAAPAASSSPTTSPSPAASPEPTAPGFAGTYAVTATIASVEPPDFFPKKEGVVPGVTSTTTWVVTPDCATGFCSATAKSNSGTTFTFEYVDGSWTGSQKLMSDCSVNGNKKPMVVRGATKLTPVDPAADLPFASLTGGISQTYKGCGATGKLTYEWTLTRTGD